MFFYKVSEKVSLVKMTFEQRYKKSGVEAIGKSISDSWNSACKGLEVGMCLVVLRSSPGGQRDLEWSEQGRE